MRLCSLILAAAILTCASALDATDPFVGTWVYSAPKSPKPTIKYAIRDLGDNRYALTGSTNTTVEIKADGVPITPASGTVVSFKKLDDHNWEMMRNDGQNMVRTYKVSSDDKTLTLHDVFKGEAGDNYELTTKYARISEGKSLFGEWQSISMEEKTTGEAPKFIIAPFQNDGLSFSSPAEKHLSEMKFDGKLYTDSGANDKPGHSSSGKRVNEHALEINDLVNGKLEESEELTVSEDGKTLTIVSKVANSSAVFTSVWDKQ